LPVTELFNGMTGLLADTFGGPVVIDPDGAATTITAVFRLDPIEIEQDGEPVLIEAATLKVRRHLAGDLVRDTLVAPQGEARYRIRNRLRHGSPASDGHIIFELYEEPT
jgi:hypothetical protein